MAKRQGKGQKKRKREREKHKYEEKKEGASRLTNGKMISFVI